MKKTFPIVLFVLLFFSRLYAQHLRPGFDKAEVIEMLKISGRFGDSAYAVGVGDPQHFKMIYRSPVIGLDNCWDLWASDSQAVISVRGTTVQAVSWLANFYGAMVPARGELHIADSFNFKYDLAENPRAAVHVGWLIGTAFLSRDMLPKIDSIYKAGIKEIYITGHSQGGAISYLLTSYLYSLQKQNLLPRDIRFKTYCTAAPKPGNLYYAYDYEAMTQFGWAFNIVNSADWVPEGMFTIQTVNDFNNTNPFTNAKALIDKLPFPKDLVLNHFYNRLDQPLKTAEERFQDCLGNFLEKYVKQTLPQFHPPVYANTMDYVRIGRCIVLLADADYYKIYPDNSATPFVHHFHPAYLYLVNKLPESE